MAQDLEYKPVPYIYRSRGLVARPILDQAPEYTYLDMLNCLEREEDSLSSRYGTQIINRDPVGLGTSNNFFTHPVTTIAKLNYQTSAWRYAGTSDGQLWRRTGNGQGAYISILTGLSGLAFDWVIDNSYQSSTPWIYIADANLSVKDNGSVGASPTELWGIDPPTITANAVPYSPLLTLIDNFASGNSYSSSGFSGGWSYASVTSIPAQTGQLVTDFVEFTNLSSSTYTLFSAAIGQSSPAGSGLQTASGVTSGFPSVAITPGETITLQCSPQIILSQTGGASGTGSATYQYSIDGGATWTTFYSQSITTITTIGPTPVNISIPGATNLSLLQTKIIVTVDNTSGVGGSVLTVTGGSGNLSATISAAGIFGLVCNGILSNLNTNSTIAVPISSILSSGLSSGVYTTITVTTQSAHGLSAGSQFSVYGSSNDILDGFYQAITASGTTITAAYVSGSALSATGGFVMGGATAPAECILTNEYSTPYPTQMSAWGFYQQVPTTTSTFPIGSFIGTVAANSTATVGNTLNLDLSINNQVTDDDLIVITLKVGAPANITNIRLQFDVNGSGYTSAYYYKDITPAYYQGNIANQVSAYQSAQQQILADTLGLLTGAPPNSATAQLQPGNLSTGSGSWTAIYLRRGDFLPVGNAGSSGLDWTNITGWQLVINTATTGPSTVAANGLYLQWGYGPSSFGGVGYDYRYTYYSAATGTESNPSPEQQFNSQFGYLPTLAAPFFLRQAAQVTGYYSTDTQVTHVRIYRRGGTYAQNWYQIDQIPNLPSIGGVLTKINYKDVIPDSSLAQANILVLDNDPPVTSSLPNPISTTLSVATSPPGNTIYSTFGVGQIITVANSNANFVTGQTVLIGNANNLEEVLVVNGSASYTTGQFQAVVRLQHNAGEPVIAESVPRQKCNLCALAYNQIWLAGDSNNPHYLYYSKKSQFENFGPENYIAVSSPDDPINAVINWRGTLIVGTLKTWYIIVGGAQPYAQPTGSQHGIVAQQGWIEVEGSIWYQAADGIREFTGSDGHYMSLPVEWIFRGNPLCIPPQADPTQLSQSILCYYNNTIFTSYVSLNNSGQRYRLNYDNIYKRYRYDDIGATAMLWEKDTNAFLVAKQISAGNYAIVQDQVGDYDDGGWSAGSLVQTPINISIQSPYRDLGKPHNPKQWNEYETDVNTKGQVMTSTLLFEDGSFTDVLTNVTTTQRQKVELFVGGPTAVGVQAYRASIKHTMAVTTAPILYQEDIYATVLAEYSASTDTYWLKFGTEESKFIKQGYFDYTSNVLIYVDLYADNIMTPYFSFVLPVMDQRSVVRVRFGTIYPGTTAFTCRTWRMIASTQVDADDNQFQMWASPRIEWKVAGAGHTYQVKELEV